MGVGSREENRKLLSEEGQRGLAWRSLLPQQQPQPGTRLAQAGKGLQQRGVGRGHDSLTFSCLLAGLQPPSLTNTPAFPSKTCTFSLCHEALGKQPLSNFPARSAGVSRREFGPWWREVLR